MTFEGGNPEYLVTFASDTLSPFQMSKNVFLIVALAVTLLLTGYLLVDRSNLKKELKVCRKNESELKKDLESDKETWSAIYRDCVEENKTLIAKMKEYSRNHNGSSSN
jgi:hypothetical protein